MPQHKKQIIVLFIILFLVMVGFGIIIPLLPFLVTHFGGTSTTLGFLLASYSIMQFFFAPIWGKLSDRIGRRPVLLIGLAGYGITFVLFGLSTQLWMLFAARILSGILSSATLPTAMAYITDITAHDKRTSSMGMMGAAMGTGMIFGPALGGWLGHLGLSIPFFAAAGLSLVTLPFAFIFLQESLPQKYSHTAPTPPIEAKGKITLAVLKSPLFTLYLLAFIISFSMSLFESTFVLFAADRVNFGPKEMGLLFALIGTLSVIIQGGLISRLVKKFGDLIIIFAGLIISAIGLILLLIAPNIPILVAFTGIFTVGNSLLRPSVSSLISKVSVHNPGSTMGIMQSFDSLGRIFGPIIGGMLFALNINLPYIIASIVMLVILPIAQPKLKTVVKTD